MFTGLVEDMGTVARADRRSNALVLGIEPARMPVGELDGRRVGLPRRRLPDRHRVGRDTFTRARRRRDARAHDARRAARRQARQPRALAARRRSPRRSLGHRPHRRHRRARRTPRPRRRTSCSSCARRAALLRYIVEKGSIAIAGVSLTVNAVDAETFSVAIIPHTRDIRRSATSRSAIASTSRPTSSPSTSRSC